jgi:hypothetical protein
MEFWCEHSRAILTKEWIGTLKHIFDVIKYLIEGEGTLNHGFAVIAIKSITLSTIHF